MTTPAQRLKKKIRDLENFHRVDPATITINRDNTVTFEIDTETIARSNEVYTDRSGLFLDRSPIRPNQNDKINWAEETETKRAKLADDELQDTSAELCGIKVKPHHNAKPTLIRPASDNERNMDLVSSKSKTSITIAPGENEVDDIKVWRALNNTVNTHSANPNTSIGARPTKNIAKRAFDKVVHRNLSKVMPFKFPKKLSSLARVYPYGSHIAKYHSDRPIMNRDSSHAHSVINVTPGIVGAAVFSIGLYFAGDKISEELNCQGTCQDFFTCSYNQSQLAGYYAAQGSYGLSWLLYSTSNKNNDAFWNGCIFGASMNLLEGTLAAIAETATAAVSNVDKPQNQQKQTQNNSVDPIKLDKIKQDLEKSVLKTGFDIKGVSCQGGIKAFIENALEHFQSETISMKGPSQPNKSEQSRQSLGILATNGRIKSNKKWQPLLCCEVIDSSEAPDNQQDPIQEDDVTFEQPETFKLLGGVSSMDHTLFNRRNTTSLDQGAKQVTNHAPAGSAAACGM